MAQLVENLRFHAHEILANPALIIGVMTLLGFIYGAFFMESGKF